MNKPPPSAEVLAEYRRITGVDYYVAKPVEKKPEPLTKEQEDRFVNHHLGKIVHYVMEGDGNHVAAIISYVDVDHPGRVNLSLFAGCKAQKRVVPQAMPRLDVEFDPAAPLMTWHWPEDSA